MPRSNINGGFYPFEAALETQKTDFDIEIVKQLLDLNVTQAELLMQMLRRFEIRIWYHIDLEKGDDKSNPRLDIATFWDVNHVSSTELGNVLNPVLEQDFLDIENDLEIAVLEKLKAKIEVSIAAHKKEIE